MFEHYSKPLIPEPDDHRRLIGAAGMTLLLIALSLALICVGVLGAPVLHRFLHRYRMEEDADA